MNKTILKQIDIETWRFCLYESKDKKWFGDFVYSPRATIDLSMLIELTPNEKKCTKKNRSFLIELSEKVRNNYSKYLQRALPRDSFEFK